MATTREKIKKDKLIPSKLVTTVCFSALLAIILSLSCAFTSVLAIAFRFNCRAAKTPQHGSDYFMLVVIKTFILHEDCMSAIHVENITKSASVFVLAVMTLVFAFINLLSALAMVNSVLNQLKSYDIFIYVYLASSLALLVIDLTLGVHFGMDVHTMKAKLDSFITGYPANYENDMIRLGALLLMSIALKGFIGHVINVVLLITLAIYTVRNEQQLFDDEHSIQRFGPINAFDPPNIDDEWIPRNRDNIAYYSGRQSLNVANEDEQRPAAAREPSVVDISSPVRGCDDTWMPIYRTEASGYPRSGHSNLLYNSDEPRRIQVSVKESTSDRICDRSPSWLYNAGASQPFSYLEDPKKPLPVKPPTAATTDPQWRRSAWPPAPVVPDPDYSPPPRKLKSALKPNYI